MLKKLPMLCVQFDFTGVSAWNPFASPNPEEGPYEGTISDVEPNYNNGKSCKFTVDLSSGVTTDLYLGNEPGERGGNIKKWKQALKAVATAQGVSDADAEARIKGTMNFDPSAAFKGKKIHVYVTAVPGVDSQGRPNLPDKEFITKSQYDAAKTSGLKKTHAPAAASTAAPANGAAPAVAAPAAATAAPAAAQGDVLGKLFGG